MDKLRVVFAREYLERVRTRWFLIATIFGPLVFGALIFVPPWLASRSKASSDVSRIVILDATGTSLGRAAGMVLTWIAYLFAAATLLFYSL